jgi:hypothetical protein
MDYQPVSLQQMKEALVAVAGSKYPVTILDKDGTNTVRYVRGFADAQNNVVLVSETSYSLAMKIIEAKDIAMLEYAVEHIQGHQRKFRAKWFSPRPEK